MKKIDKSKISILFLANILKQQNFKELKYQKISKKILINLYNNPFIKKKEFASRLTKNMRLSIKKKKGTKNIINQKMSILFIKKREL